MKLFDGAHISRAADANYYIFRNSNNTASGTDRNSNIHVYVDQTSELDSRASELGDVR